jgi:polysaccharide biosynthesis/export protein
VSAIAHQSEGRWLCSGVRSSLRTLHWVAILICVLLLPAATALATEALPAPTYLIGPGDELQITVWDQAELSTTTTVRPDGRISVPLVEDLTAAGVTPTDLADEIAKRLSEYHEDPLVTVVVVSGLGDLSQQIRIIGEAEEPKSVSYRSGMTLLDAVIASGGLSRQADGNDAILLRHEDGKTSEMPVRLSDLIRDGDPHANVDLLPGDVIVIPQGFLEGEWHASYRWTASETFSDNVDQEPDGNRTAALITRAGPGLSISGSSARVTGAFNGDLFGVYQSAGDDEGFSLDPSISGVSTTEFISDTLFFDLNASVHRQVLDARDATSSSGASTSNRDLVAAFTASPFLVHRLGDFANAEWRYRISPVFVDASGRSDSVIQEASIILDSGPDFSRLGWTLTNRAGLEERSDEGDIKTANTDLGLRYALWHEFALISGIGYEYRSGDDDEDDNFDGITWRGGFEYTPHPDLTLQATYGRRDNDENLNASLNYQVGPKTNLSASYAEALQTGQGRAVSNLQRIIIDPVTGLPVGITDDPFTFEDETTRTRTLTVGTTHIDGRSTFRFTGLMGSSDGGSEGDEDFYQARISWSRSLNQDLSFDTSASYEHSKFEEDDRTDDTYLLSLGLDYQLSESLRTFMSYSFQTRDSSDDNETFTENAVTVGISAAY